MEKLTNDIVKWLQEKVKESHTKGLVVGLSGGLDSAVVTHLIKRAFPNDSLAVVMPLKTNPIDLEHANLVINQSKIKSLEINITESHNALYNQIYKKINDVDEWNEEKNKINDANLRARLRMSTLYSVATNYNYLVVGTDNKAEWFTGYFTKYGDGGVDILPIIELTKREVRELAVYLGVSDHIVNKAPSADLWEGQTDEDEMGTSYDMIDDYLDKKIIPDVDKQIIETMHERTKHKRQIASQFTFKK